MLKNIFFYFSNGYLGVCVCILGLLGTFIVNGVMSSVNNLPMTLFGGGGDGGMEQMYVILVDAVPRFCYI